MRIFLLKLFFILITIPVQSVYANTICAKLPGNWKGNWQDHFNKILEAKINIDPLDKSEHRFDGKFYLSDGSSGELHGKCKSINVQEAYLTLRKDAPWYNPCRGTIIQVNKKMMIHFYCYEPNQSGYFIKE